MKAATQVMQALQYVHDQKHSYLLGRELEGKLSTFGGIFPREMCNRIKMSCVFFIPLARVSRDQGVTNAKGAPHPRQGPFSLQALFICRVLSSHLDKPES